MPDLDTSHVAVQALRSLVPDLVVAGGSFSSWLPHPRTLPPATRTGTLSSAKSMAELLCLTDLFQRAGLADGVRAGKGQGGDRQWPTGFIGSLTHKGTVVLATIAESSVIQMIGIDLELTGRQDLRPVSTIVGPEGLPSGVDQDLGALYVFSAKEAVFKAQYPTTRRRLGFDDLALIWEATDQLGFKASVEGYLAGLTVTGKRVGSWIVSVAVKRLGSS